MDYVLAKVVFPWVSQSLPIGVILLFFTQTLLIIALLWQRTRRRKTEAELILANDRLRLAVESGASVGWDWDVKTGRDLWFGALQTMFGIPSDTYSGFVRDFYRYVHPEDLQQVSEAVTAAQQNRTPYASEFRIIRSDGAVRWVVASGRFYYSKKNLAERMLGMAVDITDRKQAEEVQRTHDAIVEFSDDAILSEDLDGVIRSWNRGAQRLFGFSKEEAIGKPIAIIIPAELQAEENESFARVRAGQPIEHYDTVHIAKEKKENRGLRNCFSDSQFGGEGSRRVQDRSRHYGTQARGGLAARERTAVPPRR